MVVTLFSCYFLPFLLFFTAQMLLPKSLGACVIGIASASLGTLFLYYSIMYQQYLLQKQIKPAATPKPVRRTFESPITGLATKSIASKAPYKAPNEKENIRKLEREKAEMIAFFEQQGRDLAQELLGKDRAQEEMQRALDSAKQKIQESEAVIASQKAELENLKFEMYTLLRIDNYMTTKPKAPVEPTLVTC